MRAPFERVAIINRGEPAMRLINAVRELNYTTGSRIKTIAFHTEPDRRAMFVREADEAVNLGPALVPNAAGDAKISAYLDYRRLEQGLVSSGADAAWVGWGFVAEHPEFAELCERLGVTFIGPTADSMRLLGDKIAAKKLAEANDVPIIPWSGGSVETADDAIAHARRIGFPLMVKATAGGGGRGIRRVNTEGELVRAFESARAEAAKSFGSPIVYLEKLVAGGRHIEVQIIADVHGTTWSAGVRDCTVQRRHQKVIEEAPSPALDAEQHAEVQRIAIRMAKAAGYRNAGTVEFLYHPPARAFYFLEVNTRLQVEHPVTELTSGVDMVKLQFHVARGGKLEGEPPRPSGHAIEVRLNAEDPDRGFAPAPGQVQLFRLPTGPGLRVDRGVTEGDIIAPEFDSMIAKIIAHGRDRDEALGRLRRALVESAIVIDGGTTNKAFLIDVLSKPELKTGQVDTTWLERVADAGEGKPALHAPIALLEAAIEVYDLEREVEQSQFYVSAARLRPEVRSEVGRKVDVVHMGERYTLFVGALGDGEYRVSLDGHRVHVKVEPLGRFERWLRAAGQRYRVVSVIQGLEHRIQVDGVQHRVSRDDGGIIRAPSPAIVSSIAISVGQRVEKGAVLAVLEAMKMEMQVVAPRAGTVRAVFAMSNGQVGPGQPLFQIDEEGVELGTVVGGRASFEALRLAEEEQLAAGGVPRWRTNLQELQRLVLGMDIDASDAERAVAEYVALAKEQSDDEVERTRAENDILGLFTDICELFRRFEHTLEADGHEDGSRATEYLLTYLRTLETEGSPLPDRFKERIRRAVRHYGVESLQRSRRLEQVMHLVYKSKQRVDLQLPAILAILERRLAESELRKEEATPEFLALLERVVSAAEGRHPACLDLARSVRFRYFDQPLFDAQREEVEQAAKKDIAGALEHGGSSPADRAAWARHVKRLVDCPLHLEGVFLTKSEHQSPTFRALMLEVMTRRHYRMRQIEEVSSFQVDGRSFATAHFWMQGQRTHVVATHAEHAAVPAALATLKAVVDKLPTAEEIVVDLYVWRDGEETPEAENEAYFRRCVNEAPLSRRLHRFVFALAHDANTRLRQHFTFRPAQDGYAEDVRYRNLHPMIGKRVEIWRLSEFNLERHPAAEGVFLFLGTAKSNPKDQRLFALAEVRDLTPVRDSSGRIIALPTFERIYHEALAAIRQVQAKRKPEERLHWNRVFLNVWPPLTLTVEERASLVARLSPAAHGLGLQKVVVKAQLPDEQTGGMRDLVLSIANPGQRGASMRVSEPAERPVRTLSELARKVIRMRERGLTYPYEIVEMLAPSVKGSLGDLPPGAFTELDLDEHGALVPVDRPYGKNTANVVVGLVKSFSRLHEQGIERVALFGDPSREMGSLAEPECRRIIAALDLAAKMNVPVEWFALSAGAKISMESGTENMDWISRVLRKIVEHTQNGLEINVIVVGINVGAQPYWNAEATMLMHTKGILIMTGEGAMVLTGKTALDYSGSVSAEDNFGIGGYERIMGPNGQAQYFARDVHDACKILLRHYELTYVVPGERFPRKATTQDPLVRDVSESRHAGAADFTTIGDVFSTARNPGRKKPFDIRHVMQAVVDQDHAPLERWQHMAHAEIGVVWDARLGGQAISLLGIESKPLPRLGLVPMDGPERWTPGTLFPLSSKKIARAINAASGNRPVVILANLSGFDGSPESMRKLQLEYGAEIGRAVVNFRGPIVFCVISRYHGGAFVVFSKTLNDNMLSVALEGTYASVIGGAPAAAVVFSREVDLRTKKDGRVQALEKELAAAPEAERHVLQTKLGALVKDVRNEKLGAVAEEFDGIHSVERALRVGSLDAIVPPSKMRPFLVEAVERGMTIELERIKGGR